MFLGMLAPDREWLGFTKYQLWHGYCRPYSEQDLRRIAFDDVGDQNFIDKNHKRRIEIEGYVRGNNGHAILVDPKLMHNAAANPAPNPHR